VARCQESQGPFSIKPNKGIKEYTTVFLIYTTKQGTQDDVVNSLLKFLFNRYKTKAFSAAIYPEQFFFKKIKKDEGTVKLLLQLGANPNLQNNNGGTPLASACFNKSVEVVDILLGVEGIKLLVSELEEPWNGSLSVAKTFMGLIGDELKYLKWGELKGAEKLELYNILIIEKLKKFVKEKKKKNVQVEDGSE
jgi:hypothetical protein